MKCFTKRPSAKQDKLIKQECRKEFAKLLDQYNREAAIQVLHILHFDFGFGEKRLYRFADKLNEMQRKQKETYELDFLILLGSVKSNLQMKDLTLIKLLKRGKEK